MRASIGGPLLRPILTLLLEQFSRIIGSKSPTAMASVLKACAAVKVRQKPSQPRTLFPRPTEMLQRARSR